jgi:hypothetical protein
MKYKMILKDFYKNLEKDIIKYDWRINDLLILRTVEKYIPTILYHKKINRLFLENKFNSYNELLNDEYQMTVNIDDIDLIGEWATDSLFSKYPVYNISLLERNNIIKENYISTFLETKDKIVREMLMEIIINTIEYEI